MKFRDIQIKDLAMKVSVNMVEQKNRLKKWLNEESGMSTWMTIGIVMLCVIACAAIVWPIVHNMMSSSATAAQNQQDSMLNTINNGTGQ